MGIPLAKNRPKMRLIFSLRLLFLSLVVSFPGVPDPPPAYSTFSNIPNVCLATIVPGVSPPQIIRDASRFLIVKPTAIFRQLFVQVLALIPGMINYRSVELPQYNNLRQTKTEWSHYYDRLFGIGCWCCIGGMRHQILLLIKNY